MAYFSTWGAKLGLRQLTLSKFSFGYFTSQFPIILNCIACVGWSVVNSIVGAQTLRAVSTTHQIPTAAAIIVIAIGTIMVSFMGYRVVHLYEKYAWVPVSDSAKPLTRLYLSMVYRLLSFSLYTQVKLPGLLKAISVARERSKLEISFLLAPQSVRIFAVYQTSNFRTDAPLAGFALGWTR